MQKAQTWREGVSKWPSFSESYLTADVSTCPKLGLNKH